MKVLIAEDELIIAQATKARLEQHGYEVIPVAVSGEDAVRLAEECSPDVVVMDVKLRGPMDGIEAAYIIRSRTGARIVYLTGNSELKADPRLRATEPFGVLVKPASEEAMLAMIEQACKQA